MTILKVGAHNIPYLAEGSPAYEIRTWSEQVARATAAGLESKGLAAPGAADLATLTGRVNALAEDTAWANATLASGFTGSLAYKRKGGDLVARVELERGAAIAAGTVVTTLPTGFRPTRTAAAVVAYGASFTFLEFRSNGQVLFPLAFSGGAYGSLPRWPLT